ncbi:hypothetical protein ACWN8V_03890 [Vagococcus elongatus]|uniref:Uncharacterized protein n=1 Tax=Vagococcus elongatus TaxID=180344 RepID=A0A430AZS9_9ENTE|nr:hypothetical protein [Vagococcus elongatus]RSU13564.1 hypothetical protein CBF29_04745 [Vagococcus elongatus]
MKKKLMFIIGLSVVGLSFLFIRDYVKSKETRLKDSQILVEVQSVSEDRFIGDVLDGNDLVTDQQIIAFTFQETDKLETLQENDQVILEVPVVPIMTHSLPPQMPQTKIIKILD